MDKKGKKNEEIVEKSATQVTVENREKRKQTANTIMKYYFPWKIMNKKSEKIQRSTSLGITKVAFI